MLFGFFVCLFGDFFILFFNYITIVFKNKESFIISKNQGRETMENLKLAHNKERANLEK